MHKFVKKVYISMLAITLVGITLLTTTYAWVGIYANSTFDDFNLNLQAQDLSDYGIELSLTGEEGTFKNTIESDELYKIILKNMGYMDSQIENRDDFQRILGNMSLAQATVKKNSDGSLGQFYTFSKEDRGTNASVPTSKIFQFDLYISAKKMINNDAIDSNYFLNIFLQGDLFSSKKAYNSVINSYKYPNGYLSLAKNNMDDGANISGKVSVKPEYACRIAIEKYKSVTKYDLDANQIFDSTIIYEGGSHDPYCLDKNSNLYSFGGILPDAYNLALNDWNKMYPNYRKTVPQWAIDRGDIEYNYNDLNQIISKSDKVGVNTMMKLKISFWFEGWDSDCFAVIDNNPVSLFFNFSTTTDEEQNS